MKIVTVVGARPQFIKAAAVSRVLGEEFSGRATELLVHTGQHHDAGMSDVFFEELGIPEPAYHLGIAGGTHGAMTGRMLEQVEQVLLAEKPDWVQIYGDTNSTLAGALAAAKLHIPVAHVEAGLRSFNMRMPEEVNRILSDRVSRLLLCPTELAVRNLATEGIHEGVHNVGDVMYDVALYFAGRARAQTSIIERLGLRDGRPFILATCHRAENTDDPLRLAAICDGLSEVAREATVVLPLHPRTRNALTRDGLMERLGLVTLVEPLSYLDMVALEQAASVVVTDSGGVQKEAFFHGVPCVTIREETEWVELVELGWNRLAPPANGSAIAAAVRASLRSGGGVKAAPYGDGNAARKIAAHLVEKR